MELAKAEQAINNGLGQKFISIEELPAEQKQVLKDTVAKGTTDTELSYFLNVAFAQELDPFRKEVWCIKRAKKVNMGGKWEYKRHSDGTIDYTDADLVIMTGRDGFLKMAKRDPMFDYIQSSEVREGDHFLFDPINGTIEHRFGTKRGHILGAYAVITRKDGVKIGKYVTYAEFFDEKSNIWQDNPTPMIVKCAESILCKQFANVTGIIAEEAMQQDRPTAGGSPAETEAKEQQNTSLKDELITGIESCKTIEEFEVYKQEIAGKAGKLFGAEKEQVFDAAKRKKEKLSAVEVQVVEAVESPATPA